MRRAARAALRAAAALLIAAGLSLLGGISWMESRATEAPPSPRGNAPASAAVPSAEDPWGFEEIDWEGWGLENPDVIGWIQVPGIGISMPVCAAPADDPGFYLAHDAWGEANFAGAAYLDAECGGDFDAGCAPVLGHHLRSGKGFSPLAQMTDEQWAAEHSVVLIQTREWRRVYDVMFARVANGAAREKRVSFADAADFARWWDAERGRADVVLDAETEPGCAVQLVTCSYTTYADERTVVTCAPRLQLPPAGAGCAGKER